MTFTNIVHVMSRLDVANKKTKKKKKQRERQRLAEIFQRYSMTVL